tara:strand:+ start:143 stop:439 length:297 start_codon:yes stop_codon:yes gene_type:complete
MRKCIDQLIFQYYNKYWKLKITDLHQSIVWGINTLETKMHHNFVNRFDYDGIYETVLNRFCGQAANKYSLTIYGSEIKYYSNSRKELKKMVLLFQVVG